MRQDLQAHGAPGQPPKVIIEASGERAAWFAAIILFIQTIFVGVSAVVAASAYSKESKQRRRRTALDFAQRILVSPEAHILLRQIRAITESKRTFLQLTDTERAAISQLLNELELLAIAVKQGDVDESFLQNTFGSTVVGIWYALEPQVMELRKSSKRRSLWSNAEWLATHFREMS